MKNKNSNLIIGMIILVLIIGGLIYSYMGNLNNLSEKPTSVNEVLFNYNNYLNKEIVLDGKFWGWGVAPNCNLSLSGGITKSDTLFSDDSGCISMSARSDFPIRYDAYKEGDLLKIRAKVILDSEGKPVLNVLRVLSK